MNAEAMNPLIIILPPLFVIAVYTETKSHRIPNWLTGSAIVCAVLGAVLVGGLGGGKSALLGMLVGGGVFLPFCLMGSVGGGDLKLMASVGAVVGYPVVWWALYYTCLAGGALALLYMIWTGQLVRGFTKLFRLLIGKRRESGRGLKKALTVPYGVAIAIGTMWAILL